MFAWQFAKMLYTSASHGWTRFVSMQNHYNLVYREEEREMLPLCREEGIGVIPWSPLARGFLAGNRRQGRWRRDRRARRPTSFAHELYYADSDFTIADRVGRARAATRRQADAGRAGVAAVEAGRDRADRRRVEAVAPRRAVSPRSTSASTPTRCAFLEEPYQPHRILGHT